MFTANKTLKRRNSRKSEGEEVMYNKENNTVSTENNDPDSFTSLTV